MQGLLGIVALDQNIKFSSICLGNGDMLIGASNLANTIYSITTDFDGVGVLGAVNAMCSYAEGWTMSVLWHSQEMNLLFVRMVFFMSLFHLKV